MRYALVFVLVLMGLTTLVSAGGGLAASKDPNRGRASVQIDAPMMAVSDLVREMYFSLERRGRHGDTFKPREGLILPVFEVTDSPMADEVAFMRQSVRIDMYYADRYSRKKPFTSHVVLHTSYAKTSMKTHITIAEANEDGSACRVEVRFDPGRESWWWGDGDDYAKARLNEIKRMVAADLNTE